MNNNKPLTSTQHRQTRRLSMQAHKLNSASTQYFDIPCQPIRQFLSCRHGCCADANCVSDAEFESCWLVLQRENAKKRFGGAKLI